MADETQPGQDLNTHDVVIVGAGLSGLAAAQALQQQGRAVLVLDRGRSVGGRLATRQIGRATLDYGAQFFTARSTTFLEVVDQWLEDDVINQWCLGFGEPDGYPRYAVNGGMNQLARHLAAGLDVQQRHSVQAVIGGPEAWTVTYDGATRHPDEARAVILAMPVPLSLQLLRSGGVPLTAPTAPVADIEYHRVIALMARVSSTPDLGAAGARQQPNDPAFTFIANNAQKGISAEPAVTFHVAHDRSAALWHLTKDELVAELLPQAATAIGLEPTDLLDAQVAKWPHAGPVIPWPDASAVAAEHPGPIMLCGDAFGGPKIEGAYLSGIDAAATVNAWLDQAT